MAKTGFGHVFLDVACSLLLKKCSEWHRKTKIKNITQVVARTSELPLDEQKRKNSKEW